MFISLHCFLVLCLGYCKNTIVNIPSQNWYTKQALILFYFKKRSFSSMFEKLFHFLRTSLPISPPTSELNFRDFLQCFIHCIKRLYFCQSLRQTLIKTYQFITFSILLFISLFFLLLLLLLLQRDNGYR